jgi:hypothetical protein
MKKIERWTQQTYDQGALLSQLDLAVLLNVNEVTAGNMSASMNLSTADLYQHAVMCSSSEAGKPINVRSLLSTYKAIWSRLSVKELITLKNPLNAIFVILNLLNS